jgi:hypothetical protein
MGSIVGTPWWWARETFCYGPNPVPPFEIVRPERLESLVRARRVTFEREFVNGVTPTRS